MYKYYPVLVSKDSELSALSRLEHKVKLVITPVLQIITLDSTKGGGKRQNRKSKLEKLNEFLAKHWSFQGNQIVLDFSLLPNLEANHSVVEGLFKLCRDNGVNVMPSVRYANEFDTNYKGLLRRLISKGGSNICIRLSKASYGFGNVRDQVSEILDGLKVDKARVVVLIDAGYIDKDSHEEVVDEIKDCALNLPSGLEGWRDIVVATGSFPQNLGRFEPARAAQPIARYEWGIWNKLVNDRGLSSAIKYGDYATKHPAHEDVDGYSASISVKYSAEHEYVIYRGVISKKHEHGHGQYIIHAGELVKSKYYESSDFCWGNLQISEISKLSLGTARRGMGSPQTWLAYSLNHHITLVESLL